ncbi:glycosyltransferase [Salinibacter ruber]|uniref:glycosyltransferase n=1 Tax=Salinibacter ruber TaxID=146919 RepID=UPI0021689244
MAIENTGNTSAGGKSVLNGFLRAAITNRKIDSITLFSGKQHTRDLKIPSHNSVEIRQKKIINESYTLRLAWYLWGMESICEEEKFDAIICMNGMGCVESVPQITFIQQALPYSDEAMSTLSLGMKIKMKIVKYLMKKSIRKADGVIVQTPVMKKMLKKEFNLDNKKVKHFMPNISGLRDNTVIRNKRNNNEDYYKLLYVGNDLNYKNIDVLKETLKRIRRIRPNVKLFLAGPPKRKDFQKGVEYLGFLCRKKLVRAYRSADIFLMPSLVETVSLPLVEAMSFGLPIVAADRPYAHSIGGDAIRYFNPYDSGQLASITLELLNDMSTWYSYSQASRRRFSELNNKNGYNKMVKFISEVVMKN